MEFDNNCMKRLLVFFLSIIKTKMLRLKRNVTNQRIQYVSLLKNKPVSSKFGFDRGTPIDRYYIERFLNDHRQYVSGNILKIGGVKYSKKFSYGNNNKFYCLTHDTPPHSKDISFIKGDLTKEESLPEGLIDCFICTQTFNFIYDVRTAIRGAYKLLKEGGVLCATVSGLSQISRYDMDRWGDYWRFTDLSIRKLVGEVFLKNNIQVFVYGNAMSATALVQGLAVEDIQDKSLLEKCDPDYQLTIGIIAKK